METLIKHKEDSTSIIIGKLLNISGILQKEANTLLIPYNLNQQQFSILFEIYKAEEVKQKNMVNRLMLERAHVSKVVKKLQNMGLIEIKDDRNDKRSSIIKPTYRGKNLVEELQQIFKEWRRQYFNSFDEKELNGILENIDKLQKAFISGYQK